MKIFIQFILLILLVFVAVLFYKIYFSSNKKAEISSIETKENLTLKDNDSSSDKVSNLIKNLKYDVRLDENKQYIISANLSELTYENNIEIVYMQKVIAIFVDENNIPLTITADRATYNNSTYDTNFSDNIKIEYIDNVINSEKLDLSFAENIISIYDNVKYYGSAGTIKTDNVKINLITKNIQIYMDNKEKKVEVVSK